MKKLFGRVTQKKDNLIEISYDGDFYTFKCPPADLSIQQGDWIRAHVNEAKEIVKIESLQENEYGDLGPLWNRFHKNNGRIRNNLKLRAKALKEMRRWFDENQFLEVETPTLVSSPGMEPHLFGFQTKYEPHPEFKDVEKERVYSLPTSPEFHMKRLLVAGFPKIFQFARCFRNSEHSNLHEPEFTMLEFYRSDANYLDLIEDTKDLISNLSTKLPSAHSFSKEQWQIKTVSEVFKKYTGHTLFKDGDRSAFIKIAKDLNLSYPKDCDCEGIFFLIFLNFIESNLGWDGPLVLKDYPPSMAALSLIRANENPPIAERFEIYIRGIECANGFSELRDWAEQSRRFKDDQELREKHYGMRHPEDDGFIEALKEGLPPCSGIAVGFERLLMTLEGSSSIQEYMAFPHHNSLEGS